MSEITGDSSPVDNNSSLESTGLDSSESSSSLPALFVFFSLLASIGCYWVSIRGEFAFDDHLAITGNSDTHPGSDIYKVRTFGHCHIHLQTKLRLYCIVPIDSQFHQIEFHFCFDFPFLFFNTDAMFCFCLRFWFLILPIRFLSMTFGGKPFPLPQVTNPIVQSPSYCFANSRLGHTNWDWKRQTHFCFIRPMFSFTQSTRC
jgi:hypothetical protein